MSAEQYIKLEHKNQVAPGDIVYQVIQYGSDHEKHVKYDEWKVIDAERRVVIAVRQGSGPKAGITRKLRFEEVVLKAPEFPVRREQDPEPVRQGVVRRRHDATQQNGLAVIDTEGNEVKKKPQTAHEAYLALSRDYLQDLRLQLGKIDEAKDGFVRELGDQELGYRNDLERLNEQIRSLNFAHQKERQRLQATIDACEKQREPLCDTIEGIEALLQSMGGEP